MATIANLMITIGASTTQAISAINAVETQLKALNKTASASLASKQMAAEQAKMAKETEAANRALNEQTVAVAAVAVALTKAYTEVGKFVLAGVKLKSDLYEVQNVIDVTFGSEAGKRIDNFAKNAGKAFGLSQLAAKNYVGTLGAIFKSIGLSDKATEDFATTLTGLSGDLASFHNIDTERAFLAIQAGIVGEIEPLRRLGIQLQANNLEEFALAKGMKLTYATMSEADKVVLRYAYIMEKTTDRQGDFVRTSGFYANQLRILTLNTQEFMLGIGESLYPVLLPLLTLLNKIMEGLVGLVSNFNKLSTATKTFLAFGSLLLILLPGVIVLIYGLALMQKKLAEWTIAATVAQKGFAKSLVTLLGGLGVLAVAVGLIMAVFEWAKIPITEVSDSLNNETAATGAAAAATKGLAAGLDNVKNSAKKLLGLAGWDEINQLGSSSSSLLDIDSSVADIQKIIDEYYKTQGIFDDNPLEVGILGIFESPWTMIDAWWKLFAADWGKYPTADMLNISLAKFGTWASNIGKTVWDVLQVWLNPANFIENMFHSNVDWVSAGNSAGMGWWSGFIAKMDPTGFLSWLRKFFDDYQKIKDTAIPSTPAEYATATANAAKTATQTQTNLIAATNVIAGVSAVGANAAGFSGGAHTIASPINNRAIGGIVTGRVDNVTLGERGREAILPLETNTEWMDTLASKLAKIMGGQQSGDTYVYVDGEPVAASVERRRGLKTLRTNGRA